MRARLVRRERARRKRAAARPQAHHPPQRRPRGDAHRARLAAARASRPLRLVHASGRVGLDGGPTSPFLSASSTPWSAPSARRRHSSSTPIWRTRPASLRERDVVPRGRLARADGAGRRRRHADRRELRRVQPLARLPGRRSGGAPPSSSSSDGYDTGEPERLGLEMRRLAPALPAHHLAEGADRLAGLHSRRRAACRRRCPMSICSRRPTTSRA